MESSPFSYFTDAVLRGPTIGSMLMCLAASLVGVILFLRKQSLIGEALSHASYPGVILGVICAGFFFHQSSSDLLTSVLIMAGAFISAIIGLWAIYILERHLNIRSDSALCFVLSAFFGIGLTLASEVQFSHSGLYRQAQTYLYGQAATMTDLHIFIYGALAIAIVITVILFDKELQTITFNREFAKSIGINVRAINVLIFFLTVLAVVIGIRSVGVVLISAMLIAPAAAARQYTNQFHKMLALAALFGLISGFLGNYLSVETTYMLARQYPNVRLAVPTGPMIVIVAASICILSLLFAPERGLFLRLARIGRFRHQCIRENLLKTLWRFGPNKAVDFDQIVQFQGASRPYLRFILSQLQRKGWLEQTKMSTYKLTNAGQVKAAQIVRLHRLWEVYLVEYLGTGVERVHHNAEEMEHIITPELEEELTLLLRDPKRDPHQQLIPPKEGI